MVNERDTQTMFSKTDRQASLIQDHPYKLGMAQQSFLSTANHRRKARHYCTPWQLCFSASVTLILMLPVSSGGSIVLEGSQTSYAQFRQWDGGPNATLEFEVKTSQQNGLLLYTDNANENEYMLLKLVDGNIRLRFNWGDGAQVLTSRPATPNTLLDNKSWHKIAVIRSGEETSLLVGQQRETYRPILSAPRDEEIASEDNPAAVISRTLGRRKDNLSTRDASTFGNSSTNSYVFIGGLPSWYGEKLESVVLPTVLLEPRFRGSIRKLKYKDTKSEQPKVQDMMAYKGVRASTVDACVHQDPCRHGGVCISTDSGPLCDCENIDFNGVFCEKDDPSPEATLRGSEYITYNLQMRGVEPILSTNDEISLYFKTRKSSGLLFYTGNGHDYMNLALKDGGVSLTVQLGTGKLDTAIKPGTVRFDDNAWHHVLVVRKSSETTQTQTSCHVTLTVDGLYTERWMTSGSFSILASSTVFLGGSEATFSLPGTKTNNNLVGCIKKVTYKADSLHLDFLKLAQNGNQLISIIGELEWKCRDIGPGSPLAFKSGSGGDNYLASFYVEQKKQAGVISFTREEAFLALPVWKSSLSGSISFMFRTNEPNGLLLFNGGGNPGKDYFAIELLDGHLHVHLDLGSGSIKIRASRIQLHDGNWHRVELTLRKNQGRVTIDGDTEAFETPGDANQLDLVGSLYVGSVDYMDPYLLLPPAVWSATLRYGFVGCLKDLYINGAPINVVAYAHEQDVGSIRSSCHKMPDQCHDRPCMHGGNCTEGWNRYVCDCSQTGFSGPACGNAAATIKLNGVNSLSLRYPVGLTNEADDITIRFRTIEQAGLLMTTRHDRSQDKLELSLESARVRVTLQMGSAPEKTFYVGQSLNDDIYHTLVFKRRGTKIRAVVDDDTPVLAEVVMGENSENLLRFSEIHIGGIDAGSQVSTTVSGFKGSLQQLTLNGEDLFELARSGQLSNHQMSAQFAETNIEETVHHAVSFTAANTYIGLPQMKAYNAINIRFQFRTFEPNGLLMYNAGKASDFIAVELVEGRIQYTLNLGYGPINIKNNAAESLADNKWHWVVIGRPSRYRHTLMVDGHLATATTRGDNYHLDLDGILHLGGVRQTMYDNLPRPLLSKSGFQGCIASLETNGELLDPVKDALVPSPLVEEGCEESVSYEWGLKGGTITFKYPSDKRPDTSRDILSLGFITPSFDAVLMRIDSHPGATNDYLQLEIIGGKVFLNYNLGSKDITIGDIATKVNDGRYHVVRFSRSDINSTLQVDDNPVHSKFPQGNKQQIKTTVFNDQSLVQIGGRYNPTLRRIDRPFTGIIAGAVYNGLRPLDLASDKDPRAKVEGDVKQLKSIPFDYKEQHADLFTKDAQKAMIDKVINNGQVNNGNVPIVPVINKENNDVTGGENVGQKPVEPVSGGGGLGYSNIINCDDEEDCIAGSGSGDGPGNIQFPVPGNEARGADGRTGDIWYPGPEGTDSRYVPLPSEAPPLDPLDPDETTHDWHRLMFPAETSTANGHLPDPPQNVPPTLLPLPLPPPGGDKGIDLDGNNYVNYDEKWNVEEAATEEPDSNNPKSTKSMPGTMVLVIGIILGAFVAMILIVIIVLKMRTRMDGTIKGEEPVRGPPGQPGCPGPLPVGPGAAPRYQFSNAGPHNTDYGDPPRPPDPGTATTSLMEGGPSGMAVGGNVPLLGGQNNGFFPLAMNGERPRFFRKSNSSKPVREWYV